MTFLLRKVFFLLLVPTVCAATSLSLPKEQPWKTDLWESAFKQAASLNDVVSVKAILKDKRSAETPYLEFAALHRLLHLSPEKALEYAIVSKSNHAWDLLIAASLGTPEFACQFFLKNHKQFANDQIIIPLGPFGVNLGHTLFSELAKSDLAKVRKLLPSIRKIDDPSLFADLLIVLANNNDLKTPVEFTEKISEDDRQYVVTAVAHQLARKDLTEAVNFRNRYSLNQHQTRNIDERILLGLATKYPAQALELAKDFNGNSFEFGVIPHVFINHPDTSLEWLSRQAQEDQLGILVNLSYALQTPSSFRFWKIAPSLKKHGLFSAFQDHFGLRKDDLEVPESVRSCKLIQYPRGASSFTRFTLLIDQLKKTPAETFHELWRQSHARDDTPSSWINWESRLILAAWTKRTPEQALRRISIFGSHAMAGHFQEDQDREIISDWFQAQPSIVLKKWENKSLHWHTHYDEGGGLARINAAGILAGISAKTAPLPSSQWFLEKLIEDPVTDANRGTKGGQIFLAGTAAFSSIPGNHRPQILKYWNQIRAPRVSDESWIHKEIIQSLN